MTGNTIEKHPEQKITRMMAKEIIAQAKAIVSCQAEHSTDSNFDYIFRKWEAHVPKRPNISSYSDFYSSLYHFTTSSPVSPKRDFSIQEVKNIIQ